MKVEARKSLLTAIIPIGKMNGNLIILKSWIAQISNYPLKVILVHDFQDESTALELKKLVADEKNIKLRKKISDKKPKRMVKSFGFIQNFESII